MERIKYLLIVTLLLGVNTKATSCNINIDSLFNHHLLSIEKYLQDVIDGYILPTGGNLIIQSDITGKPIKKDCYNDSTKFFVYGSNADFLKMFEFINDFEWERDSSLPNIKISKNDIIEVKSWYEKNKERINCEKVEKVINWIRNHHEMYRGKATSTIMWGELYTNDKNKLKEIPTIIDNRDNDSLSWKYKSNGCE